MGMLSFQKKYPLSYYLWEVENCPATMYLLGTIHIVPESAFPLHPTILDAFQKCDQLVCELDILTDPLDTIPITGDLLSNPDYTFPDGDSLYNHFNRTYIMKLRDYLVASDVCPPALASKFYKLLPEVVEVMLSNAVLKRGGVNPSCVGIDYFLLQEAKRLHKPIIELETKELQERLLKELYPPSSSPPERPSTPPSATQFLRQMKRASAKTRKRVRRAFSLYPHLELIAPFLSSDHPLVGDRNIKMCEKIEGYLATPSSYFVAVGAMHLNGPGSIVDLLTTKGYTLRKIL